MNYDKDLIRKYGDEAMSVRLKEFQTYAVHIRDDVNDSHGRSHHALIVPAILHPLPFTNDPQYLESFTTS